MSRSRRENEVVHRWLYAAPAYGVVTVSYAGPLTVAAQRHPAVPPLFTQLPRCWSCSADGALDYTQTSPGAEAPKEPAPDG